MAVTEQVKESQKPVKIFIPDLMWNTSYNVWARVRIGTPPASHWTNFTAKPDAICTTAPPDKDQLPTPKGAASEPSENSIQISWDAYSCSQQSRDMSIFVAHKQDGSQEWSTSGAVTGTSFTITGLT